MHTPNTPSMRYQYSIIPIANITPVGRSKQIIGIASVVQQSYFTGLLQIFDIHMVVLQSKTFPFTISHEDCT
jgi:hypothetical protein